MDESPPEFLSWLLSEVAIFLSTKALHAEAEPYYHRALMIDRAAFGDDHPDVARCLSNLASLLMDTNRLSEAEQLMWDAIRIYNASLGPEHPNTAATSRNLELLLEEMRGRE